MIKIFTALFYLGWSWVHCFCFRTDFGNLPTMACSRIKSHPLKISNCHQKSCMFGPHILLWRESKMRLVQHWFFLLDSLFISLGLSLAIKLSIFGNKFLRIVASFRWVQQVSLRRRWIHTSKALKSKILIGHYRKIFILEIILVYKIGTKILTTSMKKLLFKNKKRDLMIISQGSIHMTFLPIQFTHQLSDTFQSRSHKVSSEKILLLTTTPTIRTIMLRVTL